MTQIPKWLLVSFILVSFIGFLDSTFLTLEHYNQGILPCYIFSGCDKVLTSQYTTVAGIPNSLAGAIFYLLIFLRPFFIWIPKTQKH